MCSYNLMAPIPASALRCFERLRDVVQNLGASNRLTFFANVHLPTAVVLGWIFRSVAGFRLNVVAGSSDEVWTTGDVPLIRSGLVDELPQLFDSTSREIVVVLNISRNLQHTVAAFVSRWQHQPRAMVGWTLQGGVRNTAHAASIAIEVTDRLKQIDDAWDAGPDSSVYGYAGGARRADWTPPEQTLSDRHLFQPGR